MNDRQGGVHRGLFKGIEWPPRAPPRVERSVCTTAKLAANRQPRVTPRPRVLASNVSFRQLRTYGCLRPCVKVWRVANVLRCQAASISCRTMASHRWASESGSSNSEAWAWLQFDSSFLQPTDPYGV